jgi:hypothetical protein
MNRIDFQKLSELSLKEARALLAAGLPEGAYYLAGIRLSAPSKLALPGRPKSSTFRRRSE